jgi:hypothetical protein
MNKLQALADFLRQLRCQVRLKHKAYKMPEEWAKGIGLPVRGYIELIGPWSFREVEWLEINPIVIEHIGRLVKPRQHNYLEGIIAHLNSESINHFINDGMIRISFSELSEQYSQ